MLQTAARRLLLSQSSSSTLVRASALGAVKILQTPAPLASGISYVHFSTSAKEDQKDQPSPPKPPPSPPPLDPMAAQAQALKDVKKQLWEFYLSTGRGANALFEAIDLDENGAVSPEDLMEFIEEAMGDEDPRDIMPYAWNRLEQRAKAKQQYDIKHFKKWLVAATKMSADMKNSRLMAYLRHNPMTGDLSQNRLPYQQEDDEEYDETAVYTWNEETMSQSLRRMQYAVRGEVRTHK